MTIESYEISADTRFTRNCDIVTTGGDKSGVNYQITAIACPEIDTLEVYLTQLMTNTTLEGIENTIIERDDREFVSDKFVDPDEVRKITYTDMTDIVMIKQSDYQLTQNAIFIVYKNTTDNEYDNQYSVWRYIKDPATEYLDEAHVLEFRTNGDINDMYLFDDYAIVITDEHTVSAIYIKDRDGEWDVIVPQKVFNDYERTGQRIKNSAVFGTLYNKDWSYGLIYLVVEGQGSTQVSAFNMNINTADGYGNMELREDIDSQYYFPGTVLTTFFVTNSFLIVGCGDCQSRDGNNGYLQIIDPKTLKELYKVEGRRGFS